MLLKCEVVRILTAFHDNSPVLPESEEYISYLCQNLKADQKNACVN